MAEKYFVGKNFHGSRALSKLTPTDKQFPRQTTIR